MELNWARQTPAKRLTLGEAAELLAPWGHRPLSLTPIHEGLANSNFRVQIESGEEVLLRLAQRSPENLETELAIMNRLAGRLPVPRIFWNNTSAGVAVFEWMPGQTLQSRMALGQSLVPSGPSLGRALAILQQEEFAYAGFLGPSVEVIHRWLSVFDGLSQFAEAALDGEHIRSRTSVELLETVRRCWARREEALRKATRVPCLSHADFKPSNLMVSERGELTAVLDWEFAHAGTWLLDAGQILRYAGAEREALAAAIEEGMRGAGAKPADDWHDLARTLDLANLCDFLNRPEIGQSQLRQILKLIEESAHRLNA